MLECEAKTVRAALEIRGYRVEVWPLPSRWPGDFRVAAWRPHFPRDRGPHLTFCSIQEARYHLQTHCWSCDVRLEDDLRARGAVMCLACIDAGGAVVVTTERERNNAGV